MPSLSHSNSQHTQQPVRCPQCSHEFVTTLPLANSDFSLLSPNSASPEPTHLQRRGGATPAQVQAHAIELHKYVLAWLHITNPPAGAYQLAPFFSLFTEATSLALPPNPRAVANAFAFTLRRFGVFIRPASDRGGRPTVIIYDPSTLPAATGPHSLLTPEFIASSTRPNSPAPLTPRPLSGPWGTKLLEPPTPRYYPIPEQYLAQYLYSIDVTYAPYPSRPAQYPYGTYPKYSPNSPPPLRGAYQPTTTPITTPTTLNNA